MVKDNAALGYYIQSWQMFIATISSQANPQFWHKDIREIAGEPMSMTMLAWKDLHIAMRQYEEWQNVPRYADEQNVIWSKEGSRLMDFGGDGPNLLLVPSMINGHEILHMPQPANLAQFLIGRGFHVFLLDWGHDFKANRAMGVKDYQSRLQEAVAEIGKCHLLGYCLGGTVAHLTDLPQVSRQVLIGSPWKFQHDQGRVGEFAKYLKNSPLPKLETNLDQLASNFALMPSVFLDYLFAALNPLQLVQKFRHRDIREDKTLFDAIEDWLNSGVHLPIEFTREVLINWFREDALAHSDYQTSRPTLAIYGSRDHIAPPKSCQPIANTGKNMQFLEHEAGHVGLLVGNQSQSKIWPKISAFLLDDSK